MSEHTPEREVPTADRSWTPPTRIELAVRLQEAREKAHLLHIERAKAHGEMRDAMAHHEFMTTACRHADDDVNDAIHALESQIRRETWEAVA